MMDRLFCHVCSSYTCLPGSVSTFPEVASGAPFFSRASTHRRKSTDLKAFLGSLHRTSSKRKMQPFRVAAAVAGRRACNSYMGAAASGRRLDFSVSAGRTADPEVHARESDVEPAVFSGKPEVCRVLRTSTSSGL